MNQKRSFEELWPLAKNSIIYNDMPNLFVMDSQMDLIFVHSRISSVLSALTKQCPLHGLKQTLVVGKSLLKRVPCLKVLCGA